MAVMMNPREKWTDERLDDLNTKVDQGFTDLKAEMKEGFEQVDKRFEQLDKRFDRMEDRYYELNRTLIGAAVALAVAFIGSTATLAGIALF
jgi:tetrahydromethanopterin S-methyltransferase subunit G